MQAFWLCFVPLFVAVDAFGILPLFISLTEGSGATVRRRIILQSVLTAIEMVCYFCTAIGVAFTFLFTARPA